ncbi:MAG: alpha/beta hydrolase [Desulfobacterales bacterium]|nr:alpha/beta hydrolase [Desulfobacterales bacterium]MCP4158477.1 alpha/beta hydrolase [Deltaproteobacteria bacterium]
MENKISFLSENDKIEGLLSKNNSKHGVVITHPHPHYGGDMSNIVVHSIKEAYQACGFKTLRFNFRGTGLSEGTYDDGVKEQSDVKAAISILKEEGCDFIHLSGYSFGTWINSKVDIRVDGMVMVAPPVNFIEFDEKKIPDLKLVVLGKNDEYANKSSVDIIVRKWSDSAKLIYINGCDHFFSSSLETLKEIIIKNIENEK